MRGAPRHVVLSGPPGAGKTTLGREIEAVGGIPHLSIGAELRAADLTTHFGKQFDEISKNGDMLPDDIVYRVLCSSLKHKRLYATTEIIMLDGFPKTLGQVSLLTQHLTALGHVEIDAPREILVERCLSRFGREGRDHDSCLSTVIKRIDHYYLNTKPVLDTYLTLPKCFIDNVSSIGDAAMRAMEFIRCQLQGVST